MFEAMGGRCRCSSEAAYGSPAYGSSILCKLQSPGFSIVSFDYSRWSMSCAMTVTTNVTNGLIRAVRTQTAGGRVREVALSCDVIGLTKVPLGAQRA